jgi:hypothetical protein
MLKYGKGLLQTGFYDFLKPFVKSFKMLQNTMSQMSHKMSNISSFKRIRTHCVASSQPTAYCIRTMEAFIQVQYEWMYYYG